MGREGSKKLPLHPVFNNGLFNFHIEPVKKELIFYILFKPALFILSIYKFVHKVGFVKLEKRKPSGRENDQASIELLELLREKLFSNDISVARGAAFNLSWMQEDGLEILKEALFGNFPRTAKIAATYGLRRMQGRMKKMALEVLEQGLKHRDRNTRTVCEKALLSIKERTAVKPLTERKKPTMGRIEIKEISSKGAKKSRNQNRLSGLSK